MIEKLTEQFIGVLCFRSHDVRSKVKVLELSLTLNGWVISTEEAKKRFQYCANCDDNVRAIQGHSGGEMIALELMGSSYTQDSSDGRRSSSHPQSF